MGAHCCKWVCKSCKERTNVKHKLADLYRQCPEDQPFIYAYTRGRKLVSYLKDRPDQLKLCADALRVRAFGARGSGVKFSLGLLKVLTEFSYQYFVPIAYEFVLNLMQKAAVTSEAFEVILQCATQYPEDATTSSEAIMKLLIAYCKVAQVTELELSLLKQLMTSLQAQMFTEPPSFLWSDIAEIASRHLLSEEDCMESAKLLLQRVASLLVNKPQGARQFTKFFVKIFFLERDFLEHVEQLFADVVLEDPKACLSEIFATLVSLSDELIDANYSQSLKDLMLSTLNASADPVATLMITDQLKKVLDKLASHNINLEGLISAWANKSDVQSFGRMFKTTIKEDFSSNHNRQILHKLKTFFQDKSGISSYAALAADLVPVVVERLHTSSDPDLLEVLYFLVRYSCNITPLKLSDVTLLYLQIFKVLSSLSNKFNEELLKTLNWSAGIFVALTRSNSTEECIHLIKNLKTLILDTRDLPTHYALFLLYVFLLKVVVHQNPQSQFKAYCSRLIKDYLREPYAGILRDNIAKFVSFHSELFEASDLELIMRFAFRVPDEALFIESYMVRAVSVNLEDDISIFDPLGATPSESEYSSIMSNDTLEGKVLTLHDMIAEGCSCTLCTGL